jgi:hypothetical protein
MYAGLEMSRQKKINIWGQCGWEIKVFLSDSVKKIVTIKKAYLGFIIVGFFFRNIFTGHVDPFELKWIGEKREKRSQMFTRLHGEIF